MIDVDKLNNHRLIQAGANHVLPILRKRRDAVMARIVSRYKNNEREFVGEAAELCVLLDLEMQLKQNESNLNNLEERQANERNNK